MSYAITAFLFYHRIHDIRDTITLDMDVKNCLNCNTHLNNTQKFCQNCGQTVTTHRFTLASFFHEGFHAFTHADKGIFFLLKELAIRPGAVAREYLAGKRKKYFNPFTFFLLLMALFVFVQTFVKSNEPKARSTVSAEITAIKDPKIKEVALVRYERGIKAREFMTKNGNLVAMLAIPFFAFYFWLIYYRKPFNYSEHLVANLMFVTFANLAFTLIVFPLQGVLRNTPWGTWMPFLGLLLQAFYFTVAYKGMIQLKGFWPVTKIAVFSIIGIILWSVITLSSIAIYIVRNIHFYEHFKYLGR